MEKKKQTPSIGPEQHSLSRNLSLAIKDEGVRRNVFCENEGSRRHSIAGLFL